MISDFHRCVAIGCQVRCAPRHLMCPHHWRKVPGDIARKVYMHYQPGQTFDSASTEYLYAAAAAVEVVAIRERIDGDPRRNAFRVEFERRMATVRGDVAEEVRG